MTQMIFICSSIKCELNRLVGPFQRHTSQQKLLPVMYSFLTLVLERPLACTFHHIIYTEKPHLSNKLFRFFVPVSLLYTCALAQHFCQK